MEESEDRSAYSSIGDKKGCSNLMVLDFENDSVDNSVEADEEGKSIADESEGHEDFPDSDKEEENDGSEGIDEGFLQVASAGSCNTGSFQEDKRINITTSNQDEAAMFSYAGP